MGLVILNLRRDDRLSAVMYDRDFAGRIVAERRRNANGTADEYMSTYTYGVLGMISRTAEFEDKNASNNEDFYYLSDAMGNHAGVINSGGNAQVREFDAFGRHRGTLILSSSGYYRVKTGPYMWRGGEGSESDLYTEQDFTPPADITITAQSTGLVHMGVRYYDPESGRFTQRDPVMLGNPFSMNPYAYAENDPVNRTDPSGRIAWLAIIFGLAFAVGFATGAWLARNKVGCPGCLVNGGLLEEQTTAVADFLLGGVVAITIGEFLTAVVKAASTLAATSTVGGAALSTGLVAGSFAADFFILGLLLGALFGCMVWVEDRNRKYYFKDELGPFYKKSYYVGPTQLLVC